MTEEKTEKKRYYLSEKVGQEVKIAFIDGKMLKGKLLKITPYEFIVELPDDETDTPVVVLKGSVKYIR
ncbi:MULTISPECIES: hypothetical protein [Streptococcus]|uniref:hypothetical protein n=1 Tax=Streptococcus TaxID=1301 RepID=UPI001F5825D5|nr:hypothetical protein [Streptococcus thoraltensis]